MSSGQGWARLYHHVSLIDCDCKETLEELLSVQGIERFVIVRVSDRCVIVDAQQKAQITRALARRGHPYRVTDLVPQTPGQG